jgi:hypothetical protein
MLCCSEQKDTIIVRDMILFQIHINSLKDIGNPSISATSQDATKSQSQDLYESSVQLALHSFHY